jgi:hypothetical protein
MQGVVLDFAADETAMADDRNTPVNCRNCTRTKFERTYEKKAHTKLH